MEEEVEEEGVERGLGGVGWEGFGRWLGGLGWAGLGAPKLIFF